jgi:hypothetical protein
VGAEATQEVASIIGVEQCEVETEGRWSQSSSPRWIMKPVARTSQGPHVTILNRTSIRIKNGTTIMTSNLVDRKELQVKLRYMRNRYMKLGSVKSVMTNNGKRSIISNLNRRRRVMCDVKRSSGIKDPR